MNTALEAKNFVPSQRGNRCYIHVSVTSPGHCIRFSVHCVRTNYTVWRFDNNQMLDIQLHLRQKNPVRQIRRVLGVAPDSCPVTPDNIPMCYQFIYSGEKMLQYQDSDCAVFCIPSDIGKVATAGVDCVQSDGNFKYGPEGYGTNSQIYTIHFVIGDSFIPMLVAFITHKTQAVYEKVFSVLKDALVQFGGLQNVQDALFLIDFEAAVAGAIKEVIKPRTLRGCAFHFAQSINRNVSSSFAGVDWEAHPEISTWIKRVRASVFLSYDLIFAYGIFCTPLYISNPSRATRQCCERFSTYLKNTYLQHSVFKSMWSHSESYRHRTTNMAEGFHNGMKHFFERRSPLLKDAIDYVRQILTRSHIDVYGVVDKHVLPPNSMTTRRFDQLTDICFHMLIFGQVLQVRYPTFDDVLDFLDQMSIYQPSDTR